MGLFYLARIVKNSHRKAYKRVKSANYKLVTESVGIATAPPARRYGGPSRSAFLIVSF